MLRNHRSVHFASIGEDHIAVNQLGKDQLMYCGGGRVYPAQLVRRRKLLRTQRPCHHDLGIADFVFEMIVIGEMHNLQLRKGVAHAFSKPGGSIPEIKPVAENDEQLAHRDEDT